MFGNATKPASESDKLLKGIHESIGKRRSEPAEIKSWISNETFSLVRAKSRALRKNNNEEEVKHLSKELRRSLRRDRRNRVWNVSKFIEERLDAGDVIGAFDVLKNWHRKFTSKALKPSRIDFETR